MAVIYWKKRKRTYFFLLSLPVIVKHICRLFTVGGWHGWHVCCQWKMTVLLQRCDVRWFCVGLGVFECFVPMYIGLALGHCVLGSSSTVCWGGQLLRSTRHPWLCSLLGTQYVEFISLLLHSPRRILKCHCTGQIFVLVTVLRNYSCRVTGAS